MPNAAAAEYRTKVTKPDDFDAFWDDVLRDASAVPLEAELIPDPLRTSDDVEVFQAFYTSLDHVRIAAWYCRPARRAGQQPGRRPDDHDRRDPSRDPRGGRRRAVPLWLRGRDRSDPHVSL